MQDLDTHSEDVRGASLVPLLPEARILDCTWFSVGELEQDYQSDLLENIYIYFMTPSVNTLLWSLSTTTCGKLYNII